MADRAAGDGDDPRRAARSGHRGDRGGSGLSSKPRGGLWSGGGQRRPGKDGALPYLMIAPLVDFHRRARYLSHGTHDHRGLFPLGRVDASRPFCGVR